MGRLANEEGCVLETEVAFVLAQFDSPVLGTTTQLMAVICCLHFQSEALILVDLVAHALCQQDCCGQRIMLNYLLIRNKECSTPGKGGVTDFCSNGFSSLRRQSPRPIDAIANQDISCHQPASTFANFSIPLVLTISETYDQHTATWCAPNVRRPSSKRS